MKTKRFLLIIILFIIVTICGLVVVLQEPAPTQGSEIIPIALATPEATSVALISPPPEATATSVPTATPAPTEESSPIPEVTDTPASIAPVTAAPTETTPPTQEPIIETIPPATEAPIPEATRIPDIIVTSVQREKITLTSNPYSHLSVPTQITKIGSDYFLVDCYHDRILTSPSLDRPLTDWQVLTDQIKRGHTIAGNGSIYVADDTENHRILIFEKAGNEFYQTQIIENVGIRPHYVAYDAATERFYVLSSMTGELYVFYQETGVPQICLEKIMNIPDMQNVYIRSFTIEGDTIYFAANNGTILRTSLDDLTLLEQWTLPNELAGLVQMVKIEDFYYLTISTDITGNAEYATIIRTKDLSSLREYGYDELYDTFAGAGTPYYISAFDGHYYLTQHCYVPGHGVWQFDTEDGEITNVTILYP